MRALCDIVDNVDGYIDLLRTLCKPFNSFLGFMNGLPDVVHPAHSSGYGIHRCLRGFHRSCSTLVTGLRRLGDAIHCLRRHGQLR